MDVERLFEWLFYTSLNITTTEANWMPQTPDLGNTVFWLSTCCELKIFPVDHVPVKKTQKIHRNTTSPYLLSWMPSPASSLTCQTQWSTFPKKQSHRTWKWNFFLEDKLFLLKTWLFFSGNQTNFYKFQFVTSAVLKGQVLKMFFSKWTARSPTRRLSKRTPTASKPTPYHPCMVYLPTFTIKINQM